MNIFLCFLKFAIKAKGIFLPFLVFLKQQKVQRYFLPIFNIWKITFWTFSSDSNTCKNNKPFYCFSCTGKSKGIFSYQFSMLEKLAFGHFLLMISKLARKTNHFHCFFLSSKKQGIFIYQFSTFEKLAWTFSFDFQSL